MFQQPLFAPQATPIANQIPVTANDPMARGNNRNWVLTIGGTHGAYRFGVAQRVGNLLIGNGLPIRYGEQLLPDLLLKSRTLKVQRQVKLPAGAGKVFGQLGHRGRQDRIVCGCVAWLLNKIEGRKRHRRCTKFNQPNGRRIVVIMDWQRMVLMFHGSPDSGDDNIT